LAVRIYQEKGRAESDSDEHTPLIDD